MVNLRISPPELAPLSALQAEQEDGDEREGNQVEQGWLSHGHQMKSGECHQQPQRISCKRKGQQKKTQNRHVSRSVVMVCLESKLENDSNSFFHLFKQFKRLQLGGLQTRF